MKLWIDDVRKAPEGYKWCKSVPHARIVIENAEKTVQDAIKIINSYKDNYESLSPYDKDNYERWILPIMEARIKDNSIELIDIDHDAGEYAKFGGDYIKLLDWLEETGRNYPIRIHSWNPVGVLNIRAIIKRNGWEEKK